MIRIVTIDEYEPAILKELTKILFQAFAVGTEHAGSVDVPPTNEALDAHLLLNSLPKVQAYSDDKVLFITTRKLAPRKLLSGEAPTYGLSHYNRQRAIVSSAAVKGLAENVPTFARLAMQEIGHTFGLRHCLDPRCTMYPQWTPTYLQGDAAFCVFCREQSEQRIRHLKS